MTTISWIFLFVGGAYAAADWFAVRTNTRLLELVAKPTVMVFLFGVATTVEATDETAQALISLAVVASLVGDVFLMLPEPSGPDGRDWFLAGLAAFFVAHVLYIAGLLALGVTLGPLLVGVAVAGLVTVLVGGPLLRAVRADHPALAGPVAAYVLVISTMAAVAVGTGDGRAIVGAALFVTSDALLGRDRFVSEIPNARMWIHSTYHLGQLGLVLSLL
jgi:alkenylglycerophosphocholine/alkenylglycerophosphoethanolamine hydrolase